MTHRDLLVAIILIVVLAVAALASKLIDKSAIDDLKERLTTQTVEAAATDVLVDQMSRQATADSVRTDSVEAVVEELRRDIAQAGARSAVIVARVDSIAATIDEDTLTLGLQALLTAQRDLCAACAEERDLERRRANLAESEAARIGPRLADARLLVLDLQTQRDSALALAGDAVDRLSPSWFKLLLQDLPQKAACAAGGAAVATYNEGQILLGAGIGLAACLVVTAVF